MTKASLFAGPYSLLAIVFVGAVLFRVALGQSGFVDVVYETYDSWEYRDLALSMMNHGTFGFDGVPKMNRQPVYPGFLAFVFLLFGESRLAVTAVQIGLDALTCVMVVHIGLVRGLSREAIAAVALLCVTCLYTSMYSMMMMTEVLYTFLIVLSAWALLTSPNPVAGSLFQATTSRVVLAGIALGLGMLVRPALAPAAAILVVLLLVFRILRLKPAWRPWPDLRQLLAFSMAIIIIVAPWMLRNYIVFHEEFTKPDNTNVTLFGYKTDIPVYRHWYTKEMVEYLHSNEEPFVMTKPYRPPVVVRYVYPQEREDLEHAFGAIERELFSGSQPVKQATLDELAKITERRYREAPRLHVTAPLSHVLKLWIAPRISTFWKDVSGHNSSLALILCLTAYNLAYVLPGFLGLIWGLRQATPIGLLFVVAMIVGHTWLYAIWLPMPQSRYAIPLFPLLAFSAGVLVHQLVNWRRASPALRA